MLIKVQSGLDNDNFLVFLTFEIQDIDAAILITDQAFLVSQSSLHYLMPHFIGGLKSLEFSK